MFLIFIMRDYFQNRCAINAANGLIYTLNLCCNISRITSNRCLQHNIGIINSFGKFNVCLLLYTTVALSPSRQGKVKYIKGKVAYILP